MQCPCCRDAGWRLCALPFSSRAHRMGFPFLTTFWCVECREMACSGFRSWRTGKGATWGGQWGTKQGLVPQRPRGHWGSCWGLLCPMFLRLLALLVAQAWGPGAAPGHPDGWMCSACMMPTLAGWRSSHFSFIPILPWAQVLLCSSVCPLPELFIHSFFCPDIFCLSFPWCCWTDSCPCSWACAGAAGSQLQQHQEAGVTAPWTRHGKPPAVRNGGTLATASSFSQQTCSQHLHSTGGWNIMQIFNRR